MTFSTCKNKLKRFQEKNFLKTLNQLTIYFKILKKQHPFLKPKLLTVSYHVNLT